jgi:hypothetical protein
MARTECVSACASMPLSKAPADMTLDELAQEKWKREDNLDHLQAKVEVLRRESQSQLNARVSQKRNARATCCGPPSPPQFQRQCCGGLGCLVLHVSGLL